MNHFDRITVFCSELKQWFAVHKRTLPWRDLKVKDRNHRAYLVLVSEIMLQQTQVSRVIILYKNFIQTFPSIKDLSKASNREVLIAWKGLGYNSRALRLRDAAQAIVDPHPRPLPRGGRGDRNRRFIFPESMEELLQLPGIGHYTAGAIRNFAFDLPTACIDTNIRRILHRCFIGPESADGVFTVSDKKLLVLLEDVMNEAIDSGWSAKDFYAALMDFGSLVCTKNNPKWNLMPLKMRPIFKAYGKKMKRTPVADPSKGSLQGKKREPGREVAGKFIPNRIFRGRVIDALREEERGLTLEEIGSRITIDWPEVSSEVERRFGNHKEWLLGVLKKLRKDELVEAKRGKYSLHA